MPANLENSAVATGLEKDVFIPIPKKGNAKKFSNYHTIVLISHASKVMLKILQAKLQQYMNHELPDVQAGFMLRGSGAGTLGVPLGGPRGVGGLLGVAAPKHESEK